MQYFHAVCLGAKAAMHCTASHNTHTLLLQHISYAKGKSDAVAKEDGTYKPKMKKKIEEEVAKPSSKKSSTAAHGGSAHNGIWGSSRTLG